MLPLEGLEHFSLDGVRYEAFNTSGGLGTLCDTLVGQVRELNYKTVRYVGHRDLMKLMVDELRLSEHRDQLKEILERAVPVTFQDVVVTFCTVTGCARACWFRRATRVRFIISRLATSCGVRSRSPRRPASVRCSTCTWPASCRRTGLVKQEQVTMEEFLGNRFGQYYESQKATRFSSSVMGEED